MLPPGTLAADRGVELSLRRPLRDVHEPELLIMQRLMQCRLDMRRKRLEVVAGLPQAAMNSSSSPAGTSKTLIKVTLIASAASPAHVV